MVNELAVALNIVYIYKLNSSGKLLEAMSTRFYIAVPRFRKKLGMMGFHAAVSAFLVLLFAGLCLCEKREEGLVASQSQREFDYFLLALQWPATVCQGTTHCCPSNGCCRSTGSSGFTIHGLWTNYNNGTWPACCTTAQFDIKEVKPLLKGLKKYWPSLTCSSWPTCHDVKGLFWAHEWEKHGTCSSPIFRNEYNYFLATLNLYLKYNITEILRKEGYVPSNSEKYPLGGIVSAVQNAVRATPKLVCSDGAITELYLCFYKNFQPRDCVDSLSKEATGNAPTSCPGYISLPEYRPWSPEGITSILHSSNNEDA